MKLTFQRLLFSFLFLIGPKLWATQTAIVDSLRAVIYADLERESPIGYVRKGKELLVGDVKRRNGTMLPVMVNGQVAWIKVIDIYLPSEKRSYDDPRTITEHEFLMDENIKDPLDENNYLSVKISPSTLSMSGESSSLNADLTSISSESLVADLDSATEIDLLYEHKNPYHAIHWGVGLTYFKGAFGELDMESIFLKGGVTWVPLRTSFINFEIYSNLVLSGDFRIISQGVGEYKANLFGLDYGALIRLFPESKIGVFAGVGGSLYRLSNVPTVVLPNETQSIDLSSLSGTKVEFGINYKF